MSKVKTKSIYVERPMKGYAYADGQMHEMPEDQAKLFLDKGYGFEKEPKPEKEEQKYDLPKDIPHREKLIEAGFTSIETLKNHKSLETIKGFGPKRAKELRKYLS